MTFSNAENYGRFMGRYSEPLARLFADFGGATRGERAIDVGCGPGALTSVLAERLGAAAVAAVDPSPAFVDAARARLPEVDVRLAQAERLPFGDAQFDAAYAQLVVHFMTDPVAGLAEMARVTRPGGTIAACVWDHAGTGGPLHFFSDAVAEFEPGAADESGLPGVREGHLAELFGLAGLAHVRSTVLSVTLTFATFDECWHPFTLGVGPAGSYVASLSPDRREALRELCARVVPPAPFDVTADAWAAAGRVAAAR